MLGALVLCSPSEHIFWCTLLTLWCACVNEINALREASEEPSSAIPWWPHMAYGRNLSGVYTNLPMDFPGGSDNKVLPMMQETRVQSLGREDLEKEMALHSSILTWKIPWAEEPGRLQSMGSQRVGHDWGTWIFFLFYPSGQFPNAEDLNTVKGFPDIHWTISPQTSVYWAPCAFSDSFPLTCNGSRLPIVIISGVFPPGLTVIICWRPPQHCGFSSCVVSKVPSVESVEALATLYF